MKGNKPVTEGLVLLHILPTPFFFPHSRKWRKAVKESHIKTRTRRSEVKITVPTITLMTVI